MRLRNITGARKELERHPDKVILDPASCCGRWGDLFCIRNPIVLEIGMGKGQFICGMADRQPEANFLGLEKYDSVALRALQKLKANPRQNILLIRGEAENIHTYFAPGEVARIYLNFSDPWPRKGHEKRRLTHVAFLEKYRIVLAPGGEIHIKTDNRSLFEFTIQHLNQHGLIFERIVLDLHVDEPQDNVRTEYEESRSASGATIYKLVCRFE
jgi:tRNA (guanine-N7-)-methyltransferase